ncbi:MAG: hypothetical protein JO345_37915 [Streptosporangiaceae bacterium]|nr:hypothetical protein [Streptosporangiaceae bacterium]
MPPLPPDRGELSLIRAALRRSGRATIRVTGTSMLPSIVPGSQVTIEHKPFAGVRAGEVVAFVLSGDVFVHRIAERDATRLVTAGDSMPLFDPPVTEDSYLGQVAGLPVPAGLAALSGPLPIGAADRAGGTRLTFWCPADPGRVPAVSALLTAGAQLRVVADKDVLSQLEQLDRAGHADASGSGRRALRVGVSAAGRSAAGTLAALAPAGIGRCDILVGYRFGSPCSGHATLAPDAVDYHVRAAAPLAEVPLDQALDIVAAAVR